MDKSIKTELVVGNWYTQYSAGYWQLIDLKPFYAYDNYTGEKESWKKGDRIGYLAIVKKAFTPKMKKSIRVEFVNADWLIDAPASVITEIERLFNEDPQYLIRYNNSTNIPDPGITNVWLRLSEEEASRYKIKIASLPEKFTMTHLKETLEIARFNTPEPGYEANYLLNLFDYPWELTETFDPIYCGAELIAAHN